MTLREDPAHVVAEAQELWTDRMDKFRDVVVTAKRSLGPAATKSIALEQLTLVENEASTLVETARERFNDEWVTDPSLMTLENSDLHDLFLRFTETTAVGQGLEILTGSISHCRRIIGETEIALGAPAYPEAVQWHVNRVRRDYSIRGPAGPVYGFVPLCEQLGVLELIQFVRNSGERDDPETLSTEDLVMEHLHANLQGHVAWIKHRESKFRPAFRDQTANIWDELKIETQWADQFAQGQDFIL